ncbi:hypothetical protein ABIC45_005073 [Mucilaginibacter rubeus]|uniref:hypothetical protein n=1 Tax=Mucilaginibacter rubeus TaxID=2027860 RepID=UPI003396E431
MRQRIIIPIRGYEDLVEIPLCYEEFDRLMNELPLFNNNSELIKQLDENADHRLALKTIKFKFYQGEDIPFIKRSARKYPRLITNYIYYFLIIDLTYHDEIHYSSTFYANVYMSRLALLITLSYATPVVFLRGLVIENEKLIGETDFVQNSLDFVYRHSHDINWPSFESPGLQKTLDWMIKYSIHLYSSSNGLASRALNAYSQIFNSDMFEKDTAHLFWCMLGIEALYAQGSNGVSEQIRQKIRLVLGEPTEFKKKLSKLYGYRSRLVHGDIDIPAKFSLDHQNFEKEYWDYNAFATSLLLASLKLLITQEINCFIFDYQWANTNNKVKK